MMLRRCVGGLPVIVLIGCATPSQPGGSGYPETAIQVQMNREFDIAVGQEARLDGTPIVLRFRNVSNESRCPSDVQCVWAGNAVVVLGLSGAGLPAAEASLNTTLDPRITKFGGYVVKLVGLNPYPRAAKPIPPGSYVARLEVTAS